MSILELDLKMKNIILFLIIKNLHLKNKEFMNGK